MKYWLVAFAVAALIPAAAPAVEVVGVANPTLRSVPLTLTAGGKRLHYTVEVAATPLEQNRGLMFRTHMARNHGMIFPFVPPRTASFWMENTVLPLDLIFIAPDQRVLTIAANATPYSRDLIESGGVVAAVLELNAGAAATIGLKPGDRVDYTLPR